MNRLESKPFEENYGTLVRSSLENSAEKLEMRKKVYTKSTLEKRGDLRLPQVDLDPKDTVYDIDWVPEYLQSQGSNLPEIL